jgi:THAP domain.
MGFCVAVNCGNNSFRKNKTVGVSFFRLPKNEQLKKKWLINIRRENLPKEVRICHLHFKESCFIRDLEVINFPIYLVFKCINYINI